MTAIDKNYGAPKNDPYAHSYGNTGDPYADFYGEEGAGMAGGSEFINGEEGPESAPLTVGSLRQGMKDLQDLLQVSDLSKEEKDAIQVEIRDLGAKINQTTAMSASSQKKILNNLNQKLFEIEGRIMNPEENKGEGSTKGQIEKIKKQAKGLLDAKTITQKTYDDILKDVTKAESIINTLGEKDGGPLAEKLLSSAMDKLVNTSVADPSVQKLADALGKDVKEIEAKAKEFNVDLKNPQAGPELMKMIASLVGLKTDDIKTAIEKRFKDMAGLKSDLGKEVDAWRAESENPPNQEKFKESFAYWNKTDDAWNKIGNMLTEMSSNPKVKAAFEALGMKYEAGPAPDQIKLNDVTYDFFNDDKAEFTLSTNLGSVTQDKNMFHWAPRNTEMGDEEEGIRDGWFHDNDPDGYPEDSFSSG